MLLLNTVLVCTRAVFDRFLTRRATAHHGPTARLNFFAFESSFY